MYGTSPLPHGEPTSALSRSADGAPPGDSAGTLPPGTQVGDLRIERVLGQGGYGVVYLAHDQALNRRVALKEFWPQALAQRVDETQLVLRTPSDAQGFRIGLEAFLDEARLLARFEHPSLVRVHRFWEQHGTAYMSMSWVEGRTLQALRQTMTRPPDEAWLRERLLLPLLDVLEMMHEASCLHRDISPTNILMQADLRPVLLDLGAARRVHTDMTQPLTAVLNPAFAPLEQFAESTDVHQGPWTDIYSLAAVVFFAITGTAPTAAPLRAVHPSPRTGSVLRQLTERHSGLHYSDTFLSALDAAFEVVPTQRLASAKAWREALGVSSGPVPMPEPAVSVPPPLAAEAAPAAAVQAPAPAARDVTGEGDTEPTEEEVLRAIHTAVHSLQFAEPAPRPSHAAPPPVEADAAQRQDPPMHAWNPATPTARERGAERPAPAVPHRRRALALVVVGVLAVVMLAAWQGYLRLQDDRLTGAVAVASAASADQPPPAPSAPAAQPTLQPATDPALQPELAAVVSGLPVTNAPPPVEPTDAAAAEEPPAPAPAEQAKPAVEPPPPAQAPPAQATTAAAAAPRLPASPQAACGARTNFSLYYCMQKQCRLARYTAHPQCELLRERDLIVE